MTTINRHLAIETSSPRLSLAIGDSKKVIATYTGKQNWRHAESLFKGIEALLRRARWPIQSLTGVAVSTGPGSFTGIRIGLAVARALGQSLKIPVVGVSSLEIMAAQADTHAAWLAPRIDALRDQIFTGLFKRNGALRRVVPETMMAPVAWDAIIRRHANGQEVWISPLQGCYPEARVLLSLARSRITQARPDSYTSVLPLYIRRASAEERRS